MCEAFDRLQEEIYNGRPTDEAINSFLEAFEREREQLKQLDPNNNSIIKKKDREWLQKCLEIDSMDSNLTGLGSFGDMTYSLLAVLLQLKIGAAGTPDLYKFFHENRRIIEDDENHFLSGGYVNKLFSDLDIPLKIRKHFFNIVEKNTRPQVNPNNISLIGLAPGSAMLILAHRKSAGTLDNLSKEEQEDIVKLLPYQTDKLISNLLDEWGIKKRRRWYINFDEIKYKYLNIRWLRYTFMKPALLKWAFRTVLLLIWVVIFIFTGVQWQKSTELKQKIKKKNMAEQQNMAKQLNIQLKKD